MLRNPLFCSHSSGYFCNVAVAARKARIDFVKKVIISDRGFTSLWCARTLSNDSLFKESIQMKFAHTKRESCVSFDQSSQKAMVWFACSNYYEFPIHNRARSTMFCKKSARPQRAAPLADSRRGFHLASFCKVLPPPKVSEACRSSMASRRPGWQGWGQRQNVKVLR